MTNAMIDTPAIIDTLEMDKQAFLLAQERYENAERNFNRALEHDERPSRMKLDKLEREYFRAAIALANAVCGVRL